MADRFIEQSKEIANNFIQNIVFIDDKAYKNGILRIKADITQIVEYREKETTSASDNPTDRHYSVYLFPISASYS